jgi:transketolase
LRNIFVETLYQEACLNQDLVLITGDLGFQLFDKFSRDLPTQFINMGLTEQSMMSIAAGMASVGKRVFVYSIANFSTIRCLEQIRNDVCYMNNSVVVVSVGAGFAYGTLGYTHHAVEDLAIMRALPNMEVVSPCDRFETEVVTKMITRSASPTYLRLGKSGEENLYDSAPDLKFGKFSRLSSGDSGYLFFTGSVGSLALEARDTLRRSNKFIEVVSVPFVSSLDETYLQGINRELPIVVLEEHFKRGGLGAAFFEKFNELNIRTNIRHVAATDGDLAMAGSQDYIRMQRGITLEAILDAFRT